MVLKAASFTDVNPAAWNGINNTVELFNDATKPNIIVATATSTVLVSVHVVGNVANTTQDLNLAAHIAYTTNGANPTCGTSTSVGQPMNSGFSTSTLETWTDLNGTFVHAPGGAAGSTVKYTLCSSTSSLGTTVTDTATSIAFSLVELGADVAENYYTTDISMQPGDLVAIDSSMASGVKKSSRAYDKQVLGVVSTLPGLVLNDYSKYTDGADVQVGDSGSSKLVPIALSGRIPVKVSRENGAVKAGDYLTASSIPGVAMKATKAGPIIGQAISDYDDANGAVGLVAAFVKNAYYNGETLADNVPGLDVGDADKLGASSTLLKRLVSNNNAVDSQSGVSDIVTDNLTAGVEIVTPTVTTANLNVDSIASATGSDIAMNLDGGKFVVNGSGDATVESVVTFDSLGNAFFAGEITAGSISADSIIGFKDLADQLSSLSDKVNGLATEDPNGALIAGLSGDLNALKSTVDGQTLSISDITNRLGVIESRPLVAQTVDTTNGLLVSGEAALAGGLKVDSISSYTDLISFNSDSFFFGRPYFNNDMGGFVVVRAGDTQASVVFDRDYLTQPVVNASVSFEVVVDDSATPEDESLLASQTSDLYLSGDLRYVVMSKSVNGFTIKLGQPALFDIKFSWMALAVRDARTVFSQTSAPVIVEQLQAPVVPSAPVEIVPVEATPVEITPVEAVPVVVETPADVAPETQVSGVIDPVVVEPVAPDPVVVEPIPTAEPVVEIVPVAPAPVEATPASDPVPTIPTPESGI